MQFEKYEQKKTRAYRGSWPTLSRQQKVALLTKHSHSKRDEVAKCATVSESKVLDAPPRGRSVIFIDWDDTLLPSSNLERNGVTLPNAETLREQDNSLAALLLAYEESFVDFVRKVEQAGDVCNVTNAVLDFKVIFTSNTIASSFIFVFIS